MLLQPSRTLTDFPKGAIANPLIDQTIPATGLEHVYIDIQIMGNLLICFDAVENVTIKAAGESHLMPDRIERTGNTLHIAGKNLKSYIFKGQRKKILLELHLPKTCHVSLTFVGGVVALDGGCGDLTVKGVFGEVCGITESRKVSISLRCGDVSLNELSGEADIRISLGSSTLGWSALNGKECVNVRCGFGGVDLLLAPEIAPASDQGGFFKSKSIIAASGASILASVWFGGLETIPISANE